MHPIPPTLMRQVTTTLTPRQLQSIVGGVFNRRLGDMQLIEPPVQAVLWVYEWLRQFDILDEAGIERAIVRLRPELDAWLLEYIAEKPTQFLLVVSDWRWYTWRNQTEFYDAFDNCVVASLPRPAKTMLTLNVGEILTAKQTWLTQLRLADVLPRPQSPGPRPAGEPHGSHAHQRAPRPPADHPHGG